MLKKINKSFRRFPFHKQLDTMDCGPTCLRMVAEHYGKTYSLDSFRENAYATRGGVSLLGLQEAAETIGMRALPLRMSFDKLIEVPLPCIAHWKESHFVVVRKVKREKVYVADPAHGLLTYSKEEFLNGWQRKSSDEGVVLLLEPTAGFQETSEEIVTTQNSFYFLLSYLTVYRRALLGVVGLMLLGSLIQIALPFLTQAIVDYGIGHKELNIVYLILLGQFSLYFGQTIAEFARSRVLLRVGTRVNISIISDFLTKLMYLPLSFFNKKMMGDLLQRINDHYRVETFLTASLLNVLFAILNLVAFTAALFIYDARIFLAFVVGSCIYSLWVLLFMKQRRNLDYKRFGQLSENQNKLIQLIKGMPEIKLNGAETRKLQEWQQIQESLYEVNIASLSLTQYQQGGATFINELKNIVIVFMVASSVITGQMTLGMMMAVQFIVGQLNSPLLQLLQFIRAAQDARISLERLGEVHGQKNEDRKELPAAFTDLRANIIAQDLSFQYMGPYSPFVLKNVQLHIPTGKVTAIVGQSGSGKTTLLKLLLKFYEPTRGGIWLGGTSLTDIDSRAWRAQCGVVMQDGYLFSDAVARNIALSSEQIDYQRLYRAVEIANIKTFIESLPQSYETKVGQDGHDLSRGQKQRLLIARAVYKNPAYIFFDEATNALDATNERTIMEKLERFFEERTVIVIAHRLSTVKKADQIIVLHEGGIIEQGRHLDLVEKRGAYYDLVKDQLELEGEQP